MNFQERFKERVEKQGEKIDREFKDRPMSKERYERVMTVIGGILIVYLVFSLLCVIKVIGDWL